MLANVSNNGAAGLFTFDSSAKKALSLTDNQHKSFFPSFSLARSVGEYRIQKQRDDEGAGLCEKDIREAGCALQKVT